MSEREKNYLQINIMEMYVTCCYNQENQSVSAVIYKSSHIALTVRGPSLYIKIWRLYKSIPAL